MASENLILDSFVGRVKSYGIDIPASVNEAGDKTMTLTDVNNHSVQVSMNALMNHNLFTTFSKDTQIKINCWHQE